jgi:hypothetical protein
VRIALLEGAQELGHLVHQAQMIPVLGRPCQQMTAGGDLVREKRGYTRK